jgi:hypothetical protein
VYPAAVGFHDELEGRPMEVHPVLFAVAVDDRHRQVGGCDQPQEATLQL